MTSVDDLASTPAPGGWAPGLAWDGDAGTLTTHADRTPDAGTWSDVMEFFGMDPEKFVIDGPVRHSAWEVPGHGVQHAYRARVVARPERAWTVEEIADRISAPVEPVAAPVGDAPLTVMVSDQHIGKSEMEGAGTPYLVDKWKRSVLSALGGARYPAVNVVLGGDTIEGHVSQGGKNIGQSDLTLTEQIITAQHLVAWTVREAARHAPVVHVAAVPGNHTETTRVVGVPMTDNWDLLIARNAEQAWNMAGGGADVRWHYPAPGTGDVTWSDGAATMTAVHGHTFRGQMSGAEKWWSGHIANGLAPAESTILLAGHFHNFQMANWARNRWIIFAPALERKSTWFVNRTGSTATPGVLSFTTSGGTPVGVTVHG